MQGCWPASLQRWHSATRCCRGSLEAFTETNNWESNPSFRASKQNDWGRWGKLAFSFVFLLNCPFTILKRLKGNNTNEADASTSDPDFQIAITHQKCLWSSGNPHALLLPFASPWQEMSERPWLSFSKIRLIFSKQERTSGSRKRERPVHGKSLSAGCPERWGTKGLFPCQKCSTALKRPAENSPKQRVFFFFYPHGKRNLLHSLPLTKDKTICFHN